MSTARFLLFSWLGIAAGRLGIKFPINQHQILSRIALAPKVGEALSELKEKEVFDFPDFQPESLVWRRFAPQDRHVHWIGQRMASAPSKSGKIRRYLGFLSADCHAITTFRTAAGFGFSVSHAPTEGLQHAHISFYSESGDLPGKPHRSELRLALVQQIFKVRTECPAP